MRIIIAILLIVTLLSCKEEQRIKIVSKSESFIISCNNEYELKLKNNDVLIISTNTFICNQVDSFNLNISYLKDKLDIVFSGVQTVTTKGNILESGGMFKLNYPSSIKINPNSPVEYRVADKFVYPQMEQFEYEKKSNSWTQMNTQKIENTGNQMLRTGRESYIKNCSNCHAKDLSKDGTGPALAHVDKFRSEKWFIDYTTNSQLMLREGDSISNCLWDHWKPSIMTSFTKLDTNEIRAIYSYIENETEVTKIKIDSSKFIIPCNVITNVDSEYYYPAKLRNPNSDNYYIAKVYSNSWYNVDYFIDFEFEIENPELKITNSNDRTKTVIAFTNYNTVIRFSNYNGKYILSNAVGKKMINWPKDEEVFIISYQLDDNGEIEAGKIKKHIFKESNNLIEFELEKMSGKELNAGLKELGISS